MDTKEVYDLYNYRLCKNEKIDKSEAAKYQGLPNTYILTLANGETVKCEIDEQINTRILFRIFKCVYFIKNVFLVSLICGGIAVIMSFMK